MTKFNAKNLAIALLLSIVLIGITGIVNAQQALPKGGNSFETAVKLEPGNYQGGSLKEAEYFYITGIKPGQEIDIKGTFIAADVEIGAWAILALYDKDKTELAGDDEGFYDEPLSLTVSWLHTGKESDKYYIKTECDTWEIGSYVLEISLKGEGEEVPPVEGGASPAAEESEEAVKEGQNWVLILAIIAVIIIVGIAVYFFLKKKK